MARNAPLLSHISRHSDKTQNQIFRTWRCVAYRLSQLPTITQQMIARVQWLQYYAHYDIGINTGAVLKFTQGGVERAPAQHKALEHLYEKHSPRNCVNFRRMPALLAVIRVGQNC